MSKYTLAVDLGGTNIRAAIFDAGSKLVHRHGVKTPRERPDMIIGSIVDAIKTVLKEENLTVEDVDALGIASPGLVNNDSGMVLYANNLGWSEVPLRDLIMRDLPVRTYIENDANVAALAEAWLGANKGMLNSIVITLGTGVGGGVIADGKLLHGNNFAGGELGHMVIIAGGAACNCGRRGCWEAYSSAGSLIRLARAAALEDKESLLWEAGGEGLSTLLPEHVFDMAFNGDKAAKSTIERYLFIMKQAMVNLVNIFQPEQIAIGGGIGNQGERITLPMQMAVNVESYGIKYLRPPKIVSTALGADAGLYGAALLPRYYEGGIRLE